MKGSTFAAIVLLASLAHRSDAAGITKTFLKDTIMKDSGGNTRGRILGQTSWLRNGYRADAALDLTLTIQTVTTKEEEASWDKPVIAIVMSVDSQSTDAEYLEIGINSFRAGQTGKNASETNFAVGSYMPDLTSTNSNP